jgi:hypothetical protein
LSHYATSQQVAGWIPGEVIGFFNLPNPFSHTMVLGSTQPLTEMSTRNFPGGKEWPAHKADNLNAICEPLSIKYGSLNVSQSHGPPQAVTGIDLPLPLHL